MAKTSKELEDQKRKPTATTNGSKEGGREGEQGVLNRPGRKDDDKAARGD
jgi:hypothetical protein